MMVITPPFYAQTCAVRRAKSAKLIGLTPVTFWTSFVGWEPRPEAMVSVSMRSGGVVLWSPYRSYRAA